MSQMCYLRLKLALHQELDRWGLVYMIRYTSGTLTHVTCHSHTGLSMSHNNIPARVS